MKINLLTKDQFGYHTDLYMYAKYLSREHDVKVFCLNQGHEKVTLGAVEVVYSFHKIKVLRLFRLLKTFAENGKGSDVALLKYFPGCSLATLFVTRSRLVLDIRTLSVSDHSLSRHLENAILRLEMLAFHRFNVVSKELAEKLKLKKYRIVGLGAEIARRANSDANFKRKTSIRMLYVGTLHNRAIETLILGLHQFTQARPANPYFLRIVGSGYRGEELKMRKLVESLNLTSKVTFGGYLRGEALEKEFREADLGIVQVPNKSYFEYQPSTKLYEYWAHGLPVLASNYPMNQSLVREGAGLIYEDTPDGFAKILFKLCDDDLNFEAMVINRLASQREWSRIVHHELMPAISPNSSA